tara:strand:- start:142 stop:549 length:408 start_codon:yes stop_codon:yes gene_type:complete
MQLIGTYLCMLVFFLLVDAVMIVKVINPLFQSSVSDILKEQVNFLAASIFYVFYVFGIYWFGTLTGIRSGSVVSAFFSGLFLGLLAYSTYEITNFSTIRGWTIQMVIMDTLWGGVLGGLTSVVGFYVYKFVGNLL